MPVRPITEADLDMILEWRNSDFVRLNMITQHVISAPEHRAWYDRISQDESCRWFVYQADGASTGVAYITNIQCDARSAEWGVYKAPLAPSGTGVALATAVLDKAFHELPIDVIYGDVLESNAASLKLHEKLGFIEHACVSNTPNAEPRPHAVIRMMLSRSDWSIVRARLPTEIDRAGASMSPRADRPDAVA